jgi:hypothetical protein
MKTTTLYVSHILDNVSMFIRVSQVGDLPVVIQADL